MHGYQAFFIFHESFCNLTYTDVILHVLQTKSYILQTNSTIKDGLNYQRQALDLKDNRSVYLIRCLTVLNYLSLLVQNEVDIKSTKASLLGRNKFRDDPCLKKSNKDKIMPKNPVDLHFLQQLSSLMRANSKTVVLSIFQFYFILSGYWTLQSLWQL